MLIDGMLLIFSMMMLLLFSILMLSRHGEAPLMLLIFAIDYRYAIIVIAMLMRAAVIDISRLFFSYIFKMPFLR